MDQVHELESAILARADRLAGEYRKQAERSRDNILRAASEKLHLREEREVLVAKARAERVYRRRVQANELKLQKEMDHLRWNLVEGVQARLAERMRLLSADPEQYQPLLKALLTAGIEVIEHDALVAEVNAKDLEWLTPRWDEFVKEISPATSITLSSVPIHTLGGVMVRSSDNRVRVNNTFEGRMERLKGQLHQIIIERLLPNGMDRVART